MLLTNRFTHDARVGREARTLADLGHEVTIHCLLGDGLPEGEEDDGVWVVRHREPEWLGLTGAARVLPLLRYFARYEFLARAAERGAPDVVHGHDLETLLPAARLAQRLGIPHVHDDHELGLEKLGQGVADWVTGPKRAAMDAITAHLRRGGARLEKRLIPRAAALITASPLYGKVLHERYGVEPVVLLNTPPRTDPAPTPLLRERAGLPADARVVLYQGTITPSGGAEEAIDAAVDFPAGWHLVFLGTTWMRDRLEARATERGVSSRVHFLAAVPPSELPAWTRAADIGIAPIRPTNKGQALSLANKLFEYLQAGLPMVVSDLPAQSDLMREMDAGEILPEITPAAIATAVQKLAAMPDDERAAWGARLRDAANEKYCWEQQSPKLVEVYDRVLESVQ